MKSQAKIKMQKRIKSIPSYHRHIDAVPQAVDNENLPTQKVSMLKKARMLFTRRLADSA